MYKEIIALIQQEGDRLVSLAGSVKDSYKEKQWTTEHDSAIEEKFSRLIRKFGSQHKLYSEEIHSDSLSIKAGDVWIIDPISHTIRFIHGIPHYAIVVSHLSEGEVVFAVVYDPEMKELFTAEKGKGAYCNSVKLHVKNIHSKPLTLFNPYPLGNWTLEESMNIYRKIVPLGYIDAVGSMGLYCAYIAAGRAQLAVIVNKDTFPLFAGKLLVEEAGGKFSDFKGMDLTIESRGVIAGVPDVYTKALALLR